MIGGVSLTDRHQNSTKRLALLAALMVSGAFSVPAYAQQAEPQAAVDESAQGDIVVTARRKSESILTTPIAISALTAETLAAKGSATIQDIAQSVPGLNVQNAATTGGRADRSFTAIQLRGFVPSTSSAQVASIFIDGAPVSVATALQALTNPERVEVIKGPQSALFGRQTFAGAINVVSKAPSDHLTGSASMSLGTRANYDVQGEISAPLVTDVLGFRLSGRVLGKDGSYDNYGVPNQTLGDQMTYTGSLAVEFKPTPYLTFKVFGLATELKDGPAATGLISAVASPGVAAQSNCRVGTGAGSPFFCGTAPGLSGLSPSSNVAVTDALRAFLNTRSGDRYGNGTVSRVVQPEDSVDGYGLVNHFRHIHFSGDWDIGDSGFALHTLTAYNTEKKAELADLDNVYSTSIPVTQTATNEGYYNFPFMIQGRSRDFSQEVRATYEGESLHASIGGSYLLAWSQTDSGSPYLGSLTAGGATQSRTHGVFGSLGYDFSDKFSLSADARYQIDKLYAFASPAGFVDRTNGTTVAANQLIVSKVYRTFLPRVIGQFNWDPRNMLYASFSKGVNPGAFNTTFISSAEPQVRAKGEALGYQIVVNPEKITNYEVGAKGRLFGRVRYDAAGYLAIWTDQIQNQSLTFAKLANNLIPADQIGGTAAVGASLQATGNVNSGRVRVWGLEGNLGIDVARGLTLDLSGAYVNSYILEAKNFALSNFYYGNPNANFRGKENPFVSKWSGAASVAYTAPVSDTLDGFGRVDFTYKSGGWSDIANSVRAPDMNQVNVRLGVKNKTYSVEAWMTNVFNNRAYYNVSTQSIIAAVTPAGTGGYSTLIAQLRELRTAGIRVGVNF